MMTIMILLMEMISGNDENIKNLLGRGTAFPIPRLRVVVVVVFGGTESPQKP